MIIFGRELSFAKPPVVKQSGGSEVAWSETSLYRGADFPKYNPDALLERKGYAIYAKMLLDEQIKAVVRFKRDAITSRDYVFACDYEELSEDEQQQRKYLFEKILEKMETPFTDSLNGVMSAMYNGFSLTEKVRQPIEVEGKTWYGIKRLKLRPCDTFFFHVDEFGNIEKVTQQFDGKEQEIDITRFIHFVQNPDYDEHYGRSELRECYRAYFSKDMIIKFQNIHLERFAAGFIWVAPKEGSGKTINPNSVEFTNLQNAMKNLQASSSIILPSGIELNIEHPATTDAFERAIAQHDKSIAKALLVPNLMGISEQGSTGSYAQSQTQLEAFLWTLDADATRLEAALNQQLFKELGDLNFGDGMYPQFKFKPVSDTRKLEIVKIWQQLVTAGAVQATDADEAFLRDALELPKKPVIEGDAPDLILNGAQVQSLVGIVAQVGNGGLSPEAGKALITAVFPISEEQAAKLVDKAKVEQSEPAASGLPVPTKQDGTPLTPQEEETIVGKMGITVSAFRKMFWNEDQPRDEAGRWGDGDGGGGLSGERAAAYADAAGKGASVWNKGDAIAKTMSSAQRMNLREYSYKRYGVVNSQLRNPPPSTSTEQIVKSMDKAFRSSSVELPTDALLYRGGSIPQSQFESISNALKEGNDAYLTDPAYKSTSLNKSVADRFVREFSGGGEKVKLHILAPKGTKVIPMKAFTYYAGEKEILLGRGGKYKVEAIEKNPAGHHDVYVQYTEGAQMARYEEEEYFDSAEGISTSASHEENALDYFGGPLGVEIKSEHSRLVTNAAFTKAMKRVDFAVIANKADNSTKDTAYELAVINSAAVERLVALAEDLKLGTAEGNPNDIQKIQYTPSEMSQLKAAATKGLVEAWRIGEAHAKKEVAKAQGATFATDDLALQDAAAAYIKQKGYTLAGDISAATQKTIRNILMEGVKVSKTAEETKQAVYKALEADGMLTEEAVEEALGTTTVKSTNARIETAIRTTSFEAINEARYNYFSDPALSGFVEALEYSAILDDRTTEICSQLNGETFGIDSDVWSTFRPPNHFNCRSLLIPVTVRDTWTAGDEPSVMPQKGFGFARKCCGESRE